MKVRGGDSGAFQTVFVGGPLCGAKLVGFDPPNWTYEYECGGTTWIYLRTNRNGRPAYQCRGSAAPSR